MKRVEIFEPISGDLLDKFIVKTDDESCIEYEVERWCAAYGWHINDIDYDY